MVTLTMRQLRQFRVPDGAITLWWLGQSGFIVKSPGGRMVAIDPYLSNSCKAVGDQFGFNMDRMVPPPITPAELVGIDAYAITHSHQDHLDPETVGPYRAGGGAGPFVAPPETVEKLRAMGVPENQLAMVWPNKSFTVGDLSLRATFAIPFAGDDLTHVGYLASVNAGPTLYVSGDTAYHEILPISLAEHKPDVVAAVINPAFRNMSPADAACLAQKVGAKVVIPCHYDLFPDNSLPPQMLHSNLKMLGIGERYRALEHGRPFTYPETA